MAPSIRDFKPHQVGLRKVLGDLEADIMDVVWDRERVMVREVHQELLTWRELAYTTVMTVMGRLVDKGFLFREPVGNAYAYMPVDSRQEFMDRVAREVVDGLMAEFAEPAVSHFVHCLSREENEENLQQLEELLRQTRSGD